MRGDDDRRGDAGDEWRGHFPSVAAYVDGLPDGWVSFPECTANTVLLAAIRAREAFHLLPPLPEPIQLSSEPNEREWLPEVHYVATMLAVFDAVFAGDREAFLQWAVEMSAARTASNALLSGDTERMLRRAPQVWSSTHRGTTLHLVSVERGCSCSELQYPAAVFPAVMIEYYARIYAVALVRTDAAQPEITTETAVSGADAVTTFTARWRA